MFDWLKKTSFNNISKTLGQLGEEFAQEAYIKLGFELIAKNEFNKKGKRLGEIDFIVKNKDKIIFVEVKTRSLGKEKFGSGAEAVNQFKQKKLLKAVFVFLGKNPKFVKFQPQIDVCLVDYDPVDKRFIPVKIIANAVENIF
jgi:putative endonuclease